MASSTNFEPLIQIETAGNGAPAREPEVWDERIADYNPLFGHAPEPAPLEVPPDFDVVKYLGEERTKDLLRFSTAGSVDDGKSTLIGRLLYDTQSVYDDQIRSIEGKGTTAPGVLDLALLTDGLRAEREQGITIDVAYRYFATARRKFIIADTPGHEQYTRNMATGASTADLAIVLVDARKGVLVQSKRHACITALLGVRQVVIAVNKMDLVGFDRAVFERIRTDFLAFFEELGSMYPELRPTSITFLPVSALGGDNVARRSDAMPWYEGPSLLELLEEAPAVEALANAPFRLAVQRVIRPNLDFRGFAGQIAAGSIKAGDTVMALPSRRTSKVARIVTFSGDLEEARAPQSVTLTLADELDISRGDLLVTPDRAAAAVTRFSAWLVWMNVQPLELNQRLLLKHTSRSVYARVQRVAHRLDVVSLAREDASTLELNAIGAVEIETSQPLFADRYADNHATGSFVLIDILTNATVAAGMIRELGLEPDDAGAVSAQEREARWGHRGLRLHLAGPRTLADAVERALFARGALVLRLTGDAAAAAANAGALALDCIEAGRGHIHWEGVAQDVDHADDVLRLLERHAVMKGEVTR